MSWVCPDCHYAKYRIQGDRVICLGCGGQSVIDESVNSVSMSPVKSSGDEQSDTDEIEKQHSYDKKRKKLRGCAFKSKKEKLEKNLEDIDGGLIDMEEFKSNPGSFIANSKHRSKKAGDLKSRVHRDLLSLNRECGYSVNLNCFAPVPKCGKRGESLSLYMSDCDGRLPKCVCKPYKVVGCSCKAKQLMNVGIQLEKCPDFSSSVPQNAKVLTPLNTRRLVARKTSGLNVISPISGQNLGQSVQNQQVEVQPQISQSDTIDLLNSSTRDPPSLNPHVSPHSPGEVHDLDHDLHVAVTEQSPQAAIPGPSNSKHPHSSWSQPVSHHLHTASKDTRPQNQQLQTPKTKNMPGFTPPTIENLPKSSRIQIPFSQTFPLQINGLAKKKGSFLVKDFQFSPDKISAAVCGVCSVEKRAELDPAFR